MSFHAGGSPGRRSRARHRPTATCIAGSGFRGQRLDPRPVVRACAPHAFAGPSGHVNRPWAERSPSWYPWRGPRPRAVAVVALVRRACGGGGCDLRGARPAAVLARRWSSRRSRSVQGATRSFSSGRSRICFSVSRRVSRTWPTDARASESARASCSSRGCARRTCAGQSKRRAGPRVLLECVHRAFHEPAARRAHRRRESPHRLSAQRRRLGCERSAPCMHRGSCARTSRPRPSSRWRGILARPDPARGCGRFGSSPRWRGTRWQRDIGVAGDRFIPARGTHRKCAAPPLPLGSSPRLGNLVEAHCPRFLSCAHLCAVGSQPIWRA